MNAIRISWQICRHSLAVLNQNRRLIVFPAAVLLANMVIVFLVALPIMFGITVFDIWDVVSDLPAATERLEAYTAAMEAASPEENVQGWSEHILSRLHFILAGFVLAYYLGIFLMAFLHVAAYSEILTALDGGRVSIARGFRFAVSRLKSIAIWSLFAGTVGVLIRVGLQWIPFVRGYIAGLMGLTWSVASVFAIPVLIRDDAHNNPLEWLRSSARLIKRSWGEALSLIVGPVVAIGLIAAALPFLYIVVTGTIYRMTPAPFDEAVRIFALVSSLTIVLIFVPIVMPCLIGIIYKIFRCSLYVYAAEGVAPGSFDASLFDRAWKVRDRKQDSGD